MAVEVETEYQEVEAGGMNTALFEDVHVAMDDQPHIKLQQWYVRSSISLTIIIRIYPVFHTVKHLLLIA